MFAARHMQPCAFKKQPARQVTALARVLPCLFLAFILLFLPLAGAQAARLHVGKRRGKVVEHEMDLPAKQIVEWGKILPNPDEEAEWFASVPDHVKKRMADLLS